MHWSKKYVEREPIPTQAGAGDRRIASLKQTIARCDGQIASLKQSVARCDGQIASLKQTVAGRDDQVGALEQAVAERERQLRSLQENYDHLARDHHDLDVLLEKTLNSWSWRITYPFRAALGLVLIMEQRIRAALAAAPPAVKDDASLLDAPVFADADLGRSAAAVTAAVVSAAPGSDAAALALARTGKFPSQAYLAAIAPVGLKAVVLQQKAALPKYSIVILQLNQAQLTINCINSILRNTPLAELEILVVDNGSSSENIAALAPYDDCIRLLEVGVNRHYGEGNNLGIEHAKGEFVILMNNDIVVTAGWLETIAAELKEGVGAVGPCLLYPDELVQEAGGYMMANGSEERRYMQMQTDVLPVDPFECDYASAALLLIRRRDFFAIGGFDLYWEPAYYEDVDLCLKLRAIGLKVLCCPAARVFHVGNATSSDRSLNLYLERIVNINKAKFASRWGPFLLGDVIDPAVPLLRSGPDLLAATISDETASRTNKPRALIYTASEMKLDAGSRFILRTAVALARAYDVTLVFTQPYSALRLRQLGAYFRVNVDRLKVSTPDKALSVGKAWEAAFVFGSSTGPTIPAPSKCSFYLSEFPSPTKSRRSQQRALSAGYVYVCYGKSAFSPGRGLQRGHSPTEPLKNSKRKSDGIGFTAHCSTRQVRKNYAILAKALTATRAIMRRSPGALSR